MIPQCFLSDLNLSDPRPCLLQTLQPVNPSGSGVTSGFCAASARRTTYGYRGKIQAYLVKREIVAGTDKALSQDPSQGFGTGGGTQLFLSNYKTALEPIGNPFRLGLQSMKFEFESNKLIIDGNILLSPFQKKNKLIGGAWEEWIKNDNEVISYRLILLDKKSKSKVFLIVTFVSPVNDESLLSSWYLSPASIMNGEQKKPEGKVTKALRKWVFDKTKIELPIGGDWGHIDASYDHWNNVGFIACNYRSSFKNESEWKDYKKRNKI